MGSGRRHPEPERKEEKNEESAGVDAFRVELARLDETDLEIDVSDNLVRTKTFLAKTIDGRNSIHGLEELQEQKESQKRRRSDEFERSI